LLESSPCCAFVFRKCRDWVHLTSIIPVVSAEIGPMASAFAGAHSAKRLNGNSAPIEAGNNHDLKIDRRQIADGQLDLPTQSIT
jgi:hypothetical protein